MTTENLILTESEAAFALTLLRAADMQVASRIELDMQSGARLVFFAGGGTVVLFAPHNRQPARGTGVLRSDENYLSIDDLAKAYGMTTTA